MLARAVFVVCLATGLGPAAAGSISGQITAANGGAPIAGFQVLRLSPSAGKGWVVAQATSTDGSGNYLFTGVAAGNHIVRAVPANTPQHCFYAHRYYDVASPFAGGTLESAADVLTLGAASAITGINIALNVVGAIEGTVTQGSVGLGNVLVRVEKSADWNMHIDGITSAAAGTLGVFTICGVDTGSQRLWIHHPNSLYEDRLLTGPYFMTSGVKLDLGSVIMAPISTDPYEPNGTSTLGSNLPATPAIWNSSGAILTPGGSDVDFYCLNALAGQRYIITTTTDLTFAGEPRYSPWVDPMLGWFATAPVQLLLSNDDTPSAAGPLNARLDSGIVSADGRYCIAVTSYGDPDFNGSGQVSAGRYGLRVDSDSIFVDGFGDLGP